MLSLDRSGAGREEPQCGVRRAGGAHPLAILSRLSLSVIPKMTPDLEHQMRLPTKRPPTHPGEILLEEFLLPLQMTQQDLADRIGVSYPRINELVNGKRGVTPDTVHRLSRLFGTTAEFWLNGQLAWDLWHAQRSPKA